LTELRPRASDNGRAAQLHGEASYGDNAA